MTYISVDLNFKGRPHKGKPDGSVVRPYPTIQEAIDSIKEIGPEKTEEASLDPG